MSSPQPDHKDVLEGLKNARSIPTLPESFLLTAQIVNDPNADLRKVYKVLNNEPALMANILRVANSAYLGMKQPVTDLEQAIAWLGMDEISRIALATGCFSILKGSDQSTHVLKDLWLHSVTTALFSSKIAAIAHLPCESEAFLAGLLHDLGKLYFAAFYPESYIPLRLEILAGESDALALEANCFGLTHLDAARHISEHWKLPPGIAESAVHHHNPLASKQETRELVLCVAAANILAHFLIDDEMVVHDLHLIDEWLAALPTSEPLTRASLEPLLKNEALQAKELTSALYQT